jgi:hypothetical protein
MKVVKPITILLFSFFKTVVIFSQTHAVLNYLPDDAKTIIKINPASLGQKMKWDELVSSKMFEDMMKDVSDEGKEVLKNPAQTGIDPDQGFFLIMGQNKNNKPDPVFYGTIKDTARFAAMVKKIIPQKQVVKLPNGKLVIDKNTAVAWNNEVFVLTGSSSKEQPGYQPAKSKASSELTKTKQLTERCKVLLSKRKTAFSNEYFTSLLKEDGDMFLWINNNIQSNVQKKSKAPKILEMVGKNLMRSGNYTSGVIKFESGKVSMQMKRYISASLDSIYKKYPVKNINTALLKKLPAGQPIFLYSFSFSPEMINEMFVKAGADKYIDSISRKKVKMGDIVSAIQGDATLVVMKAYEFTEEDSVTQAMNGLQLFLAGSIKDKEKFKNLSAVLLKQKEDTAKNSPPKKMKPFILSNDSIFVASISQIAAQKFLESPGNNEEMEKLIYPYKDYPGAVMIDLRTIFNFSMQAIAKGKSEEDAKKTSEVLSMFDKLISYGGHYDNNFVPTTIEITLTGKDENSLKQFIDLLNVFYLMDKKPSTNN